MNCTFRLSTSTITPYSSNSRRRMKRYWSLTYRQFSDHLGSALISLSSAIPCDFRIAPNGLFLGNYSSANGNCGCRNWIRIQTLHVLLIKVYRISYTQNKSWLKYFFRLSWIWENIMFFVQGCTDLRKPGVESGRHGRRSSRHVT